jgi:uncharacterized protein (TIGR03437 family)
MNCGRPLPGRSASSSFVRESASGAAILFAISSSNSWREIPSQLSCSTGRKYFWGPACAAAYASGRQVNALVPEGLAPNTTCPLVVVRGTAQSVPVPLAVTRVKPDISTVDTSGSGAGVVTNAISVQLIAASNPAHPEDYLTFYGTGLNEAYTG